MIFGLLAIFCWFLLASAVFAFALFAVRKNRLAITVLSAFLLSGFLAAALVWQATRPPGLTFGESLKAGLTNEGLLQYGHPIEHRAEVAICLSSYACVLGGAVCAGALLAGAKVMARRRIA